MAKTQSSLSDDPKLVGRPTNFTMTVREIRFSTGAEFIIPILGNMMTMPGLPKVPAANNVDIDEFEPWELTCSFAIDMVGNELSCHVKCFYNN